MTSRLQCLHRHRADAHRRHKRPDLTPLLKASETIGKVAQAGRHRHLRIHCLPRRHRRRLRAGAGKGLRSQVQPRFLRRLQPRAHQPRRQGAPRHHDQKGHLRLHAGSRRPRRRRSTARSSPPAPTRPPASRSPKPPRSSRTPSATSISP